MGYCPREGYKVASVAYSNSGSKVIRYCPREGYKVASMPILHSICEAGALLSP